VTTWSTVFAALVLLPVDDHGVDVRPLVRDEILYVSASPARTQHPATIQRLAEAPLVFSDAESADLLAVADEFDPAEPAPLSTTRSQLRIGC
jgi:hypothetical protein